MADIVLLDNNENEVEHAGVRYISVPTPSGDKTNYMSLANARCYFGQMDEIRDDVYTFTPKALWISTNVNHGMLSACSDGVVKGYGKYMEDTGQYQMAFLFTHRQLEIDRIYNTSEL